MDNMDNADHRETAREPLFSSNGRDFFIDGKSVTDAKKLASEFEHYSDVPRMLEWLNGPNGEKMREILGEQSFKEGDIVTVRLRVVDPLFTNILWSIMYGKSEADGKALNFLGFQWEELSLYGTAVFSPNEVELIRAATNLLRDKLTPNDAADEA